MRRGAGSTFIVCSLAFSASMIHAQAGAPPVAGWEPGWHVVRPGDTLEGLARKFLGTHDHWRELHRLNPAIADPNVLKPGQRIRVWLARPSSHPTAQVEALAGRVEERPAPVPWRPAREGDLLLERDALRTFASGSSRLRFEDRSTVTLTENSLVFVRHHDPATAPSPKHEIEVQIGQADVEAVATDGRTPEIEIVVGEARGRARATDSGALHARSSADGRGAARVMVYRGAGEVAAAGATVALSEGTGTSVEPSRPPTPAEALLPAPELSVPVADGPLGRDEPRLAWTAVPAAASYTVEVCADAFCGSLVERSSGVAETQYRLREPPAGATFWRVTAVSASGLDGYPSAARRFTPVESVGPPPPTLALLRADGSPVGAGDCIAEPPRIVVEARDRYGRPLDWSLRVDDRPVEPAAAFAGSGSHEVVAEARDAAGRTARSAANPFVLDLIHPWVELPAVAGAGVELSLFARTRRTLEAICALGLERSQDGARWDPVPCAAEGEVAPAEIALTGDSAQLQLRSARDGRLGEHLPLRAGESTALRLGDVGCGLSAARLRVVADGGDHDGPMLELAVIDGAGRESRTHWRVEAR